MQKKDVHLGEHTENHISLTEKDTGQLVKEIKALHKQQIKAPTTLSSELRKGVTAINEIKN